MVQDKQSFFFSSMLKSRSFRNVYYYFMLYLRPCSATVSRYDVINDAVIESLSGINVDWHQLQYSRNYFLKKNCPFFSLLWADEKISYLTETCKRYVSNCAQQLIIVPVPVPCLDHVFLRTGPARASINYFHIKQNRNLRLLPIDVNGTDEPPVVMTTDRKVSERTWCAKKMLLAFWRGDQHAGSCVMRWHRGMQMRRV